MPHEKADPAFLVPKQSFGMSIKGGEGEVCVPDHYNSLKLVSIYLDHGYEKKRT